MWKKNALGQSWLLGETIITGIGQGYIKQLNSIVFNDRPDWKWGYKIYPKIIADDENSESQIDKFTPLYKD